MADRPYSHVVHYDDGTSFTFVTLERPNIHFDSGGQMTHINLAADLTTTDSGCGHGRACAECKFYRHCGTTIIKLDTGGTAAKSDDDGAGGKPELMAQGDPIVTWASHPVLPDQVVLLQVSPFPNGSRVLLSATTTASNDSTHAAASVAVEPLFISDAGVAVVVPPTFPRHAVYTAAVEGSGAPPLRFNEPDIMWIQGSEGDSATPGGWIRAFGRSLAFTPLGQLGLAAPPAGWLTTMRLTPTATGGGKPTVVVAEPQNLTSFTAVFRVPADMRPGEYDVAISNGPSGFVELDCFVHPTQPHVRSITIAAPRPAPAVHRWRAEWVHGVNATTTRLIDSSEHLRRALVQAGEVRNLD